MASVELLQKKSRCGDNVDWISSLPDTILCHILSRLTTEEVIRTSVLSKRWEHVWKSIPVLEFTCGVSPFDEDEIGLFEDYVDNVLSTRAGILIDWCKISCPATDRMPAWVSSVISYGVRELTLEMFGMLPDCATVRLPEKLFSCSTLSILRISGVFLLKFPYDVTLPNLKKLHLSSVIYPTSTVSENVFSGFPKLEELHICRENWDCAETMNISVPLLRKLSISCELDEEELVDICTVVIHAPKLEYLELDDGSLAVNYTACILNSLVEARFDGNIPHGLCDAISNVKILWVSSETMEFLECVHLGKLPVSFHSLYRLELGVDLSRSWSMLVSLLESSPNLQVLVFKQGLLQAYACHREHEFTGFYWDPPESVPSCLLLHLKRIEINNFAGRRCEVFLTKYLLNHAVLLEKMVINCHQFPKNLTSKNHNLLSIREEVLSLPRGSEACQVDFII